MHILAALAQWYSENPGQEIKKGLSQRAREGLWLGRLGTGYCSGLCSQCDDQICPNLGQEDKGDGRVPILHPVDSKGIRLAFETYATGRHTVETLASFLSTRGFGTQLRKERRHWTRNALKEVLKHPYYMGYVRYDSRLYPGKHEAIVTEELWRKCQEIRELHASRPKAYLPKHRTYLFAGILRCVGCGGRMTADTHGKDLRYYRCTAHQRAIDCQAPQTHVREDALIEQMGTVISRLRLPDDWRDRVLALLQDGDETERIKPERARLEEKLRRLRRVWIEVEIEEAYYLEKKAEAKSDLARLVMPDRVVKIEEAENLLDGLSVTWEAASREERRAMLGFMFEEIYCDPTEKRLVALEPQRAFIPLLTEIRLLREDGGRFYMEQHA